MDDGYVPVLKQSLSDGLALRIRRSIQMGEYQKGDRLPAIMEMARRFGVGHPTVREALKKLETMGVVDIRHGSGVYVSRSDEVLVLASQDYMGTVDRKLLLDLVDARIPIEVKAVAGAATNATEENFATMRALLDKAAQNFADDEVLSATNMAFHQEITQASGNLVLSQLLDVLRNLFQKEQRLILNIYGSPQKDQDEHLGILAALEARDERLAVDRMQEHLEGVRDVVLRWDPVSFPVG
jgi:GntR family transcriptional regulator, transcriptional repressor for pyruvate dehydrogenase complex